MYLIRFAYLADKPYISSLEPHVELRLEYAFFALIGHRSEVRWPDPEVVDVLQLMLHVMTGYVHLEVPPSRIRPNLKWPLSFIPVHQSGHLVIHIPIFALPDRNEVMQQDVVAPDLAPEESGWREVCLICFIPCHVEDAKDV